MQNIIKTLVIITLLGGLCLGIASENYEPTWESLKTAPIPEWIKDAKFGIYTHWGVYSVPAFKTNLYGREIYVPWDAKKKPSRGGETPREYHEKTYGSIFDFGYKDFVPMFTAPKFDAAEWAQVMADGGVKFAGICMVHHDGYCLWDSEFTRWDSKDTGPKKDIFGELVPEIRKRGMNVISTFHHARTYGHHFTYADQFSDEDKAKLDLYDEQYDDLYRNPETVTEEEFSLEWHNKINEVIRKYQPDALWFDGCSNQMKNGLINEQKLLKTFADYYNNGTDYVDQTIVMNKLPAGKEWNFPTEFGLRCYENGRDMESDVRGDWLIDRAIGYPWTYVKNKVYKDGSDYHIVSLCDLVSRGGLFLLSLTPKGDGSIPEEEVKIMKGIGDWLKVNGEGIYSTRPWKTVAEGIDVDQIRYSLPSKKKKSGKKESWNWDPLLKTKGKAFRFTRSKDFKSLYAFVMGQPEDGKVTIKTFRKGNVAKNGKGIKSVTMLGSDEKIDWKQTKDGLTITFPEKLPCDVAYGFKIQCKGKIDNTPRETFNDKEKRQGDWPIFNSKR